MSKLVQIENLESRRMMSVSHALTSSGLELVVTGTAQSDQIVVTRTAAGYQVNTNGIKKTYGKDYAGVRVDGGLGNDAISIDASIKCKTVLSGGEGNDTLVGGSGADRMIGGAGNDQLRGMGGNDTLLTIGGGKKDRAYGGAGVDSFWTDTGSTELISDASATEVSGGSVHRVSSFINGASKEIDGQNLSDPTATATATTSNFSNRPLFADAGPAADDVRQGYLGDCYFLATLSSIAKVNPAAIRNSVVELGDGTYAVNFKQNGADSFVRVDGDLATFGNSPAFAKLGAQNSMWVAVLEKAFAFFRTGVATYDSIEAGWMSEAYDAMGVNSQSRGNGGSATSLLQQIKSELALGKSVTFAVNEAPEGSGLVGCHAYSVDGVITNSKGAVTSLRLRNPWAVDGYSSTDGKNDGYVTVSASVAFSAVWAWTSAKV